MNKWLKIGLIGLAGFIAWKIISARMSGQKLAERARGVESDIRNEPAEHPEATALRIAAYSIYPYGATKSEFSHNLR